MLAERLLTPVLKQMVRSSLSLQPMSTGILPPPHSGRGYMLYTHVPFCESLCPYCSFNRYLFNEKAGIAYFENLRREMKMVADLGYDFSAMYIGGGTPTILIDELCQTIDLARQLFHLREVSCETNPNHLDPNIAGRLKSSVQRLSVGVQSFDDPLLIQMKRHQKFGPGDQVLRRIQEFAGEFPTLNVDMIFNFPSQTRQVLENDVQKIIESHANQVSFYPLMTAPTVSKTLKNTIGVVDYQREAQYYQVLSQGLSGEFAPTSAWTFSRRDPAGGRHMIDEYIVDYEEYVGIGSGSFSYLDGSLYVNTFSLKEYANLINAGRMSVVATRSFDREQQMRYRFLMELFGLRLDKQRFRHDFGMSVERGLWKEMIFMQLSGAFQTNNDKELLLTPTGRYLLVVMMREFFSRVDHVREQARNALSTDEKSLFLGLNNTSSNKSGKIAAW